MLYIRSLDIFIIMNNYQLFIIIFVIYFIVTIKNIIVVKIRKYGRILLMALARDAPVLILLTFIL